MANASKSLVDLIASEHTHWQDPIVCRAVFGTVDPTTIAQRIDRFCREELGAGIAGAHFYRVSVGCVAGLDLEDGRSVVVKAQKSGRDRAYFEVCNEIRMHLVAAGFPCPRPVGAPARLGDAWVTAECLVDRGARADAHDPAVRRAIASSLAELVALALPFAAHPALGGAWFTSVPDDRTFPRPHSPVFDFDATREGAEWIEDLAARARARRRDAAGRRVVGHFDWRVEHLRFEGGRVVASYDWDSLHAELEPVLVGSSAHAFTVDWQRDDRVRTPSVDEIRAFVQDYESARGAPFDAAERSTLTASCVYSMAYTARCNHAVSPRHEGFNGDYRPLLRSHGEALLRDPIGRSPLGRS